MTTFFGLKNKDFSRWPPFNMGNIFKNFVQQDNWNQHCYYITQVSMESQRGQNSYFVTCQFVTYNCVIANLYTNVL